MDDGQPGRHGTVSTEGMAAHAEDRAGGEPGFSRRDVSGEFGAGGSRDHGQDARQETSAHRPDRDQHHRGIQSAFARVSERRARLPHAALGYDDQRARTRQQAQAGARQTGDRARPRRPARDHLHLLQHGRPGRRRLHQGEGRASSRDQHVVQRRRRDSRAQARPGRARDAADPAERWRLRSETRRKSQARRCRREGTARQVRLRRQGRRWLARSARRQAAQADDGVRPVGDPAPVRRVVAAQPRLDRHPGRVRQAEVAGPSQDGALRAASDVVPRQHQHDARRLRLHVAALRSAFGLREPGTLQPAGIQPTL